MNHKDDWDNRVAGRRNSRGDVSEAGVSLTVLTNSPEACAAGAEGTEGEKGVRS